MPIVVRRTTEFDGWLRRLRDAQAVARIVGRIRRMEEGNPGDVKSVGQGVMENADRLWPGLPRLLRAAGAGVILLCGGDKQTQARDIKRAMTLAEQL